MARIASDSATSSGDLAARYELYGEMTDMTGTNCGLGATDATIESAIDYIEQLFEGESSGHDASHSLRVYHNAMLISSTEPECDAEIVALAALLHDVDDYKLFSTEDNENARKFLENEQVDAEKIELICEAINSVSFSHNRGRRPRTLEGQIVQDADRLDAIGAMGIARTFMFGGARQVPIDGCIQHFHDKLLLLASEMNTETGKRLAVERHAFLMVFLEEYERELNESLGR